MPTVPTPADIAQRIQRDAGRMALRAKNGVKYATGVDRPKVGLSPKETVWKDGKVELWRYRNDAIGYRPPLLIVHSLVSKSYVLDLYPGNSFIERFVAAGFDVFLLDWGIPEAEDSTNTLETYIDGYMRDVFDATLRVSGKDEASVLGYCFGGVLTLLFVARYPELPVRNLLTMATPVDITKVGLPSLLFAEGRIEPDMIIDETGNVPPEVIYDGIKLLKPTADFVQYARLWQFLWNDEYVEGLQAMGQWTRDHIPFPGATFRQCVDMLFRDNGLMTDQAAPRREEVHLGGHHVPVPSPDRRAGLRRAVGGGRARHVAGRLRGGRGAAAERGAHRVRRRTAGGQGEHPQDHRVAGEPQRPAATEGVDMNEVNVRPLEPGDFDRLRAFFSRIPESDRTFFKDDVLDPAVVAGWLHDQRGRRVVAVDGEDIVGYAAVLPGFGWSTHVGELRLVVDPGRRRAGVGKALARAGLVTAIEMGLAKVVVDVIADHEGTIGLFSTLGFQAEALLRDHVRDRDGEVHDLIIMGHLVEDTWSAMATAGLEGYLE